MRHIYILFIIGCILISFTFAQSEETKKEQPTAQKTETSQSTEKAKTAEEPVPPKAIEKIATEAPKTTEQAPSTNGVTVTRAEVCTGIVDREPQGSAEVFAKDIGKVYCFTEINGAQDPVTIVHKWYLNYKLVGSVALRVKAARWRTHSTKTITPELTGKWKVEIVNGATDKVMKMVTFKVE